MSSELIPVQRGDWASGRLRWMCPPMRGWISSSCLASMVPVWRPKSTTCPLLSYLKRHASFQDFELLICVMMELWVASTSLRVTGGDYGGVLPVWTVIAVVGCPERSDGAEDTGDTRVTKPAGQGEKWKRRVQENKRWRDSDTQPQNQTVKNK